MHDDGKLKIKSLKKFTALLIAKLFQNMQVKDLVKCQRWHLWFCRMLKVNIGE
jgi:hypothetical protein